MRDVAVTLARPTMLRVMAAWVVVALILVVVAVVAGRPDPECRTVRAVAGYLDEHRAVFDVASEESWESGRAPDVAAWSADLHRFAAEVSGPGVAPHLRRIADLSDRIVTLNADDDTVPRDFIADFTGIVDEEEAALDSCRRS